VNPRGATGFYARCEHCGADLPTPAIESAKEKWRRALADAQAKLVKAISVGRVIHSE
jgi:hypothetical protein